MNKSVTVTLGGSVPNFDFQKGQFIRISGQKRVGVLVKDVDERLTETTLACIKGYRPAPRSILRTRKTIFSKLKGHILK